MPAKVKKVVVKTKPVQQEKKSAAMAKVAPKTKKAPAEVVEHSDSEDYDSESEFSDLDEETRTSLINREDVIPLSKKDLDTEMEDATQTMSSQTKKVTTHNDDGTARGVVYLGHIPYGFFEEQMTGFFTQFGEITRIRLARNKKSGRSKHYAFIEFKNNEVAQIVADTMNSYMMFQRTLVCKYIPPEKVHSNMFLKHGNKVFRKVPWQKIAREQHNMERTADQQHERVKRLLKKEKQRRNKLADLGIDYEFPGYAGADVAPTKRQKTQKTQDTPAKKQKTQATPQKSVKKSAKKSAKK